MLENLKNIIASAVKTNGNEEITGANLQSTLFRMTDELAKIGYKGNATTTTIPVVGDSPMFYLTAISGTYPRMGGLVVDKEIAALIYSGTSWSKQTLIRIDDVPTDGSTNLITSGGVASATSVLTYEQQQAINSGITAALVLEFMDKQDKVDPNIAIREGLTSVVGAINQNNENTYDDEIKAYYSWDSYTICREDEWNTDANPLLNITNIQGTQYDAARVILGGDWCIPTLVQIQELADNCNVRAIYEGSAPAPIGYRFTSKINGTSITIPPLYIWWNGPSPFATAYEGAAGITSSEWSMVTTYGPVVNHLGWAGRSVVAGAYIRPVSHAYGIDLGLPSGTRWADANLTEGGFADTNLALGDFFAFGETFTKYAYVPESLHKDNRSKHITNRERAIWNDKQNKLIAGSGITIEDNVISSSGAGGVSSVNGKTGDVTLTKTDVGLENVGNFKAVSTAASQGLSSTEKSNARANIGAGTSNLAIGTTATTAAAGDHTHAEYQPLLTAGRGITIADNNISQTTRSYGTNTELSSYWIKIAETRTKLTNASSDFLLFFALCFDSAKEQNALVHVRIITNASGVATSSWITTYGGNDLDDKIRVYHRGTEKAELWIRVRARYCFAHCAEIYNGFRGGDAYDTVSSNTGNSWAWLDSKNITSVETPTYTDYISSQDYFGQTYQSLLTPGYGVNFSNNIVNAEVDTYIHGGDDTAREILGGDWRIPSLTEWAELISGCSYSYVTNYLGHGANGYLFTSKSNGKTIFLKDAGSSFGTTLRTEEGFYQTATRNSSNVAQNQVIHFLRTTFNQSYAWGRYTGQSIRPVSPTQGVDLGLPSGLKWASSNLTMQGLAANEYDNGDFFAWGETETKDSYTWDNYKFGVSADVLSKYNTTDGLTILELGNDVGYYTAHNGILQTRLAAGRGISISNGVISSNNNCAWGTCADDKSVLNKVATTNNPIKLTAGVRVYVQFTSTSGTAPTSGNMTLNVDGTGAKAIYRNGVTGTSRTRMTYSHIAYFAASKVIEFIYDGTYWNIIG